MRLFQNFSFGTATLDLREKAGFRPLFPRACGKTIGFWNRLKYLKKWKDEIPEMPSINFDENPQSSFDEIKNHKTIIFRKLFENTEVVKNIFPILFPQNEVLKLLRIYFMQRSKEKTIYKNLAEMVDKII